MLNGADELRRRLERLAKEAPAEFGRALYQEALIEQKEAMQRCPVATGTLRGSHETSLPDLSGGEISVTISAGGPAAPYAAAVHYNLEAYHPVGEALWLERTLIESKPFIGQRVANRIDLNRLVR